MNETAIFPRVTYTDSFVVEVLDVWSWVDGFKGESREIVGRRGLRFGLGEGEPTKVNDREGERIQWSAARSDADKHSGVHNRDERTHPTPEILWTGHLTRLSTSMTPTESISGCGGRRSRDKIEQERDGGEGGLCSTRLVGSLLVDAQTQDRSSQVGKHKYVGLQATIRVAKCK